VFDEFDDHDWEEELRESEAKLERECHLRASLQKALDAGHERRAEAARQLLEAIEEND
jgi:hypothetical protein